MTSADQSDLRLSMAMIESLSLIGVRVLHKTTPANLRAGFEYSWWGEEESRVSRVQTASKVAKTS
jgi:hypothetical protein